METLLIILTILVAIVIVLAVMAPKSYDVSRTIRIDRSNGEVYDYLRHLKNMENWSPWDRKDPDMRKVLRGTDGQVGAVSAWSGNKEVGEGEQEITRLEPGKRIESRLRFFKPWKSESDAYLDIVDLGSGRSEVVWGFSGKNKFPFSIMMLFMDMDKAVGKEFEQGLADLKAQMEQPSAGS